jgi:hypothetical protein
MQVENVQHKHENEQGDTSKQPDNNSAQDQEIVKIIRKQKVNKETQYRVQLTDESFKWVRPIEIPLQMLLDYRPIV